MKKAATSKLVGVKWREIHKEWFIKYLTAKQCNHQLKECIFINFVYWFFSNINLATLKRAKILLFDKISKNHSRVYNFPQLVNFSLTDDDVNDHPSIRIVSYKIYEMQICFSKL